MKTAVVSTLLFTMFFCSAASAEPMREVRVQSFAGNVEFQKSGEGDWAKLAQDTALQESDVVRTGDNSTASLLFKGMKNAVVDLRPNTQMQLSTVSDKSGDDTELDLALGSVLVKAEKLSTDDSSFQVRTPNSIVGIRGTEFEVNVD